MRFHSPGDLPCWQRYLLHFCPSRYHFDYELGAWLVCKIWLGRLYFQYYELCHVDGIAKLHQDIVGPTERRARLERCYELSTDDKPRGRS
jgi:hypothetical protein